MKKLFIIAALAFMSSGVFAQAPQSFTYQAVIRNASNGLVTSSMVGTRISIIQGSTSGTVVYAETHQQSTNANGLLTLSIGNGAVVSGTFASIDWATGPYFVQTETDPTGGTNYTVIGTSQLMSVPYALYAETAGNPGPQGPQGAQGPAGVDGDDGLSAYEVWLNLGNTGTQTDFINSLTGPQGIQGPAGIDGAVGPQGIQGPAGNDGATGPQGIQGPAGNDGVNGQNTLVKTTVESAGTNCPAGGTKLEFGIDANGNSVLDVSEINATLTKYVCNGNSSATATYRMATFSTYDQSSWAMGNDANLFGGVNPSNWTDGNYTAANMSSNKEVLRTLFTQKGYAKANAMVFNEDWYSFSSTNGKVVMTLFRIRNNTGADIVWNPYFYYSAYSGWNENASVAINGTNVFVNGTSGSATVPITVPANRTSTVIFVSTSGTPSANMRNCRLAFYNNSLNLPVGLEFIDDLDTAVGGWEQ